MGRPVSTTRARLQTGGAFTGALLLAWRHGGPASTALVLLTLGLAALAWVAPTRYAPVQHVLDRALQAGLAALTWVLLAIVYFGFFTPVRLAGGLLRRDPLRLRRRDASTYLMPLPPPAPGRFDRQF